MIMITRVLQFQPEFQQQRPLKY